MLLILLACEAPPTGTPAPTAPHTPSDDPCDRIRAGTATELGGIVRLSNAHADIRLFGVADDFPTADAALIAALDTDDPIGAPDLAAYVATDPDICLLDAEGGALGPALVFERDGKWWVSPGTGEVEVPDDGAPVVIDLRGVPAVEGLADALSTAFAAASSIDLTLPTRRVRTWDGYVDQWYSASNAYTTSREDFDGETLPAARSGGALYVVTEDRMAPDAVRYAGAVALGGTGFLVGSDLLATVAERTWSPVGEQGLSWTGVGLRDDGGDWPDTIPASHRTDDPETDLATLDLGEPSPAERGDSDRPGVRKRNPYDEPGDPTATVASLRASLVIVHGGLRRFYPYFDVVGDDLDARLLEVLADDIDPSDVIGHRARLGRLGNVLSDGHMFMGPLDSTGVLAGYLPVIFAHVDGKPVVVRSGVEGLDPGDTIVAVDGIAVEDLQADWLTWHGGATDGYRLDLADRELWYMVGDEVLTLEDPDGVSEELSVSPQDAEAFDALPYGWFLRDNGTLDDLGHPTLGYLNLGFDVTTTTAQVDEVLAVATDGLVVDMRGYPGVNHYEVLAKLIPGTFSSPIFRVTTYAGPGEATIAESQYDLSGDADAYEGPIALLVSPVTVSAAENFSQMLVGAGRVEVVVGSASSAGTNGNITGFSLPGGYYFSFTGMEVLNPDGSVFHGVGIEADLVVEPTAADFRDGTDPALVAAAAALAGE